MLTLHDNLDSETAALKGAAFEGWEWWQLSDAEERVFAIDRARFPRMVTAWECYQVFKGISSNPNWDESAVATARAEHPEWCGPRATEDEFHDFAGAFGGLTYREAHAIWCKTEFWQVRTGITIYADGS